ncbi:MAG: pantetheine-phosphate adenylyltransferase [Thermoplasmataceae archaeon]|jgi:pantetheine-phosphate adenylyltransferase
MTIVVGGTFSILHKGHRVLLRTAAGEGDHLVIGLTTDSFLKDRKNYAYPTYKEREKNLRKFMSKISNSFEIRPLSEQYGNTTEDESYTTIVISEETENSAFRINQIRISNGLAPLKILKIPTVRAKDLIAIRSSRIYRGEIDIKGNRLRTLKVVISTHNDLKYRIFRSYMEENLGPVETTRNDSYSLDSNQPFGEDTMKLARVRAESVKVEYDYSAGIESGLFYDKLTDSYLDFHCCYLLDSLGEASIGLSSGFRIPENVIQKIKEGIDMSEAFGKLYGYERIGEREGIVGVLTNGRITRGTLISEAIRNALYSRIDAFHKQHIPKL